MKCDLCSIDEAQYDAWFTVRFPLTNEKMINQRHMVCKSCARHSIAYEKYGEKIFEIAEQESWCYQI